MKKIQIVLLSSLLASVSACVDFDDYDSYEPAVPSRPVQPQGIPGGITNVATYNTDVQLAAKFAANQLGQPLDKVISAARQVVAGTNFHLTIQLADSSTYRVVVYKDLNYNYSLTRVTNIGRPRQPQPSPYCPAGKRWSPVKQNCLVPMKVSPDGRHRCIQNDAYFDVDSNVCKRLFTSNR